MLSERVDPLIGSMLGKDYRVIEPIGMGGMAVVYLVEHQTLQKRFAAKVLSTELAASMEARARFTQEAHAASQLDHENIVTISDFGVTRDQRPFFVMELLRGQTLDQRMSEGPMSLEEVVAVSVPLARALAYAHAEAIVHRDVKPENVFLVQRSQGRWTVKVVDFGIAKTPVNLRLTKMGQTLGSPYFMAPEACRGDDVDHRADLYSFGIVLYMMLCGRLPYDDESLLKVLQMQVSSPLPPPREVNPQLSPELAAILVRALEKDADDRYGSMEELLVDLEAALPPGSDRLLIEAQSGTASAFRLTPFPGMSASTSQQLRTVSSQRLQAIRPSQSGVAALPAPRKRGGLIAVLLLVLLLGAGGAVYALQSSGGETVAATPEPTPDPKKPVATAIAAPSDPVADPPVETPAVKHIKLHIASRPAGAAVKLDGRSVGTTPVDVEVEQADRQGHVVLTKSGYDTIERDVELGQPVELDLGMSRTRTVAIRRPSPPPAEPKRKPPSTDVGSGAPNKGDPNLDIRLSR